jgi:hypothetical protein
MGNQSGQPYRRSFLGFPNAIIVIVFAVLALASFQTCVPYFRSLPSDEEMINNFHRNREDFEQLAEIYRNDTSVPVDDIGNLRPTDQVRAIMERVNVSAIYSDQVLWIGPDPYVNWVRSRERELELQRFGSTPRRFYGVKMDYAHREVISTTYMANVYKRYYYIPEVPKFKGGILQVPASLLAGISSVEPTLNTYEKIFQGPCDCAVREIVPHWFIQVCR